MAITRSYFFLYEIFKHHIIYQVLPIQMVHERLRDAKMADLCGSNAVQFTQKGNCCFFALRQVDSSLQNKEFCVEGPKLKTAQRSVNNAI